MTSSSSSSSWFGSIFGRAKEQPTIEQETKQLSTEADAKIEELIERRTKMDEMIRQLGDNVVRLSKSGHKQAAESAFKDKQTWEQKRRIIDGKIRSLEVVGTGIQDTHDNLSIHGIMVKSNAVSTKLGEKLNVENVETTMLEVDDHRMKQRDVNNLLAGDTLLEPTDPDELADDMAAFIASQEGSGSSSSSTGYIQEPPPMTYDQREQYNRQQLEDEEEAVAMMRALPVPGMTLQQRNILAQQQRGGARKI